MEDGAAVSRGILIGWWGTFRCRLEGHVGGFAVRVALRPCLLSLFFQADLFSPCQTHPPNRPCLTPSNPPRSTRYPHLHHLYPHPFLCPSRRPFPSTRQPHPRFILPNRNLPRLILFPSNPQAFAFIVHHHLLERDRQAHRRRSEMDRRSHLGRPRRARFCWESGRGGWGIV